MRRLGTIDLEILHLAMKENGTFNENSLENSELKRLGVGKILDSLASLKDRKFISLNENGSFSITELAKEILWGNHIPIWAKILRLLQIKSCSIEQIAEILKTSKDDTVKEIEELRKNQFVLMSPQRQEDKIIKVYEILPEGIEEIDKTEKIEFNDKNFKKSQPKMEILTVINEIIDDVQDVEIEQSKKISIIAKLSELRDKLEI